jgi:hypothetical protein
MKDYNLRSRDIYGEPQQRGGRAWMKIVVPLAIAAAAGAAYLQFRQHTPGPEAAPSPATSPDIIPLTLPPRAAHQGPAGRG